jgi:hypothetical protein
MDISTNNLPSSDGTKDLELIFQSYIPHLKNHKNFTVEVEQMTATQLTDQSSLLKLFKIKEFQSLDVLCYSKAMRKAQPETYKNMLKI